MAIHKVQQVDWVVVLYVGIDQMILLYAILYQMNLQVVLHSIVDVG
jgi:hypothetical protein